MPRASVDSTISRPPPSYASAPEKERPEGKLVSLFKRFAALFQRQNSAHPAHRHDDQDLEHLVAEQARVEARRLARDQGRQDTELARRILETDEATHRANIRYRETYIKSEEAVIRHIDIKTKGLKLERAQTEESLEVAIRTRKTRAAKKELQDHIDLLRLRIEGRDVERVMVQTRVEAAKDAIAYCKRELDHLDARKQPLLAWKEGSDV